MLVVQLIEKLTAFDGKWCSVCTSLNFLVPNLSQLNAACTLPPYLILILPFHLSPDTPSVFFPFMSYDGSAVYCTWGDSLGTSTSYIYEFYLAPSFSFPNLGADSLYLSVGRLYLSAGRLYLSTGRLYLSAGRLYLSVGRLYLSVGRLYLSVGRLYLSAGRLYLSAGRLYLSTGWLYLSSGRLYLSAGRLYLSAGWLYLSAGRLYLSAGWLYLSVGKLYLSAYSQPNPLTSALPSMRETSVTPTADVSLYCNFYVLRQTGRKQSCLLISSILHPPHVRAFYLFWHCLKVIGFQIPLEWFFLATQAIKMDSHTKIDLSCR